MKKLFLGIDTSCYTTSVAVVDDEENIIFDERIILDVKLGERGVRQSEAVFLHIKNMPELFERIGVIEDISAVCASITPTDEPDSYMPVFNVSLSIGKIIAANRGIKLYKITHRHMHAYSALKNEKENDISFIAAHVSGGTLDILNINVVDGIITCIERIGKTLDITCGQLIDRAGVLMGLKFPCGAQMDKLVNAALKRKKLPVCVKDTNANLSGAEAQMIKYTQTCDDKSAISTSVFDCCAETISKMIINACLKTNVRVAYIFGGVASSNYIKEAIVEKCKNIDVRFAEKKLSSDNAVGCAIAAKRLYFMEEKNADANN